jgi:hypothetical protein
LRTIDSGEIVSPNGMTAVSARTGKSASIGARLKRSLSALGGMKSSLVKNFRPSAAVWSRPAIRISYLPILMPARFGPMRSCIMAPPRRSYQVSSAPMFTTKPTITRILMTVQSSDMAVTFIAFSLRRA